MKIYFNGMVALLITIAIGCKKDRPQGRPEPVPPPAPVTEKKWVVTTIAGEGTKDLAEGPALSARFAIPEDVVVAPDGTIYITDVINRRIRKMANGQVTSFAGSNGFDIINGPGASALFKSPYSITVDAAGNLYTSDENDPRIRKITPGGLVSTFAGGATEGYVNGRADTALFKNGNSIVADAQGNIYVADARNNRIRKIDGAGVVTTMAGNDTAGFRNGRENAAWFSSPGGIAVDRQGNLFVADRGNFRIRMVKPYGVVSVFAGSGKQGDLDGDAATAQFNDMNDLVIDDEGNLYLADVNRIRKISPQGVVTSIAGSTPGFADGDGAAAKFNFPGGLGIDAKGNIYVADLNNNRIRKISWQ